MDFDLAQVRAFLAVAELRHFGRAAVRLNLTQQALSKRIQRLEHLLGEPLLARDSRAVELTEAGARFLPHARALLVAADSAVAETRSVTRPVRVDVWGHLHAPLSWMRRLSATEPRLTIEVSMRRGLPAAIDALARGEIDMAFGRVHDLGEPVPGALDHRLVCLTPLGALLDDRHPLAGVATAGPADLADCGIWQPNAAGTPELTGYHQRFAERFGVPLVPGGANLGAEHAVDYLHAHPAHAVLLPADLSVPAGSGAHIVPLTGPVPRWPWSLLWRRDDQSPAVALVRRSVLELARDGGWTRFDPGLDWLPDPDAAAR
ncbi:LysR family transcriptional regulator [Asanoa ishikariensis]|uniref:DNA-binding transcriptional regulator, LysR family n=1 Tax=Asanoa ishikariensis TaxID=137265 RepID=A0A1H3RXD4_9ACTN|nr:LysR family transcriptional regulator [Asanoa ishikariensis]GIF66713.1 LysR family transcriptional regulator [Asanoa ishikariensis]SDZ30413.1 DNA-binding transcriptional regulator, LysR family [Asanoa ishikariensis]